MFLIKSFVYEYNKNKKLLLGAYMFFVLNKRLLSVFLIIVLATTFLSVLFIELNQKSVFAASNGLTVVIDAGHGGKDNGCTSAKGVNESDLNLIFSKKLGSYFDTMGFRVIQTRETKDALYVGVNGFIKKKDMEVRKNIIEKSNADMVISIHMNEYKADIRQGGAQAFYNADSERSKTLSELIQVQLNKVTNRSKINLAGDYFMLNCTTAPSVIVECGFLSNPQETMLLQTSEYQEKLCYAIFLGAANYFYSNQN